MFDRKAHWQDVYKNKSPLAVSWYQQKPRLSLDLIEASNINNNDAIIDVGGGASTLVDHLLQAGFSHLSVLDISGNALNKSKERLGSLASKVNWHETDVTHFIPPEAYALWHDRAVFHFLTDPKDQANYVETLKLALKPGASLIIASFALGGPEKCSGLDIVQYDNKKMRRVLGDEFELQQEHHEIHITPMNKQQAFVFFHFIRK
jgi:SAM-dependent methyltransferase